jgi:hypothetical protein
LDAYITRDQCSRIIGKINQLIKDFKVVTNLLCSIVSVIVKIMIIVTVLLILLLLLLWAISGSVENVPDIIKMGFILL